MSSVRILEPHLYVIPQCIGGPVRESRRVREVPMVYVDLNDSLWFSLCYLGSHHA